MIKRFLCSWLIYWCLVAALPVHSVYPAVLDAVLLQMSFVVLVVVGYGFFLSVLGAKRLPNVQSVCVAGARSIAVWAIWLSLIGLIFLLYDKVYIQGIVYSEGLAVAREQWREIGLAREGEASSVWSALGYLVGSCYYVALVVLCVQPKTFSNGERLTFIGLIFMLALANSIITGGRSNFMLLCAFVFAAFGSRRGAGLKSIVPERRHRFIIKIIILTAFAYMVYVFFSRSQASGMSISLYVENFLPYIGLEFDGWYVSLSQNEWIAEVGHTTILVVGYLTHSLATVAAIVDQPVEDKTILFGNFMDLFYKIGLTSKPETDWFLAGRFPSVPGELFHQYGPIGFVLGSLVIGAVAFASSAWASSVRGCRGLLPLGFYTMVSSTLLLTPYVFAPDILSFPFVISAFFILALMAKLRLDFRRKK